jgi:cytochrome c oxidase cbb3-type subunit III
MSDFVSGFWGIAIALATVLGIAACFLLLMFSSRVKKMADDNSTGHVWDGDLKELNNPLPRWWVGLFIITLVFSIAYLYYYPGLGVHDGSLKWSQSGAYKAEMVAAEQRLAPLYDGFLKQTPEQLQQDPKAMAIAERLFLNNCAQCHGSDARGAQGFPNLADADWLWGGSPEAVRVTIADGRKGLMPPMGAAVGTDQDITDLAKFVQSLAGKPGDELAIARGKGKWMSAGCVGCHGADGKGNTALGAPNLTDNTWIYGGSLDSIFYTIKNGRQNAMPAWASRLSKPQIEVLTAYVIKLSGGGSRQSVAAR